MALVSGCGGGAVSHPHASRPAGRASAPTVGVLSSNGAGHRFYEIYEPTGAVRGTMLVIHGGGFASDRSEARSEMVTSALEFAARGWRVVDVDYTAGQRSPGAKLDPLPMLRDVVAFYDQIRQAFGGPICAYGQSAGAYLAAMLAVERPSLKCAILDAGPVDLPTLLRETDSIGYADIKNTFGTDSSTLARWSPARDWRRTIRTAVWATYADGDPVVPPQQGKAFLGADPSANVGVVPAGSFYWMHSAVNYTAIYDRVLAAFNWIDRIVPAKTKAATDGSDVGGDCDRLPPPGDRFRLMLAGDAWQQVSTPGQLSIAATRGCSGSAYWQDDGLSVWAMPSPAATLPDGDEASLVLDPGRVLSRLTVAFRGFLARPPEWRLGLYASTSTHGAITTPVAACSSGSCSGLSLHYTSYGALLAPRGFSGDPDFASQPPSASFTLPAGTRRVAWQLECVAAGGCSLRGIGSARPRDPLGQPAIFSLYSADVR